LDFRFAERLLRAARAVDRLPWWIIALIYLALFTLGMILGCGDPCDSRPGYEHPAPAPDRGEPIIDGRHDTQLATSGSSRFKVQSSKWRITAYCPCKVCCGPRACGVTASGLPARGKMLAAPPEIPFGVLAYVPGYGLAKVADRGGAIKGRRLDVLMPTHAEARKWGVRYVECRVTSAE
jgi:3D (Asp-Asp-Asp) domain-containing protein